MSFMQPDTFHGTMIEVRHTADQGSYIPGDVLGNTDALTPADVLDYTDAVDEEDVESITVHRNVYGVRLSAPGYMDATEWTMCETLQEARTELASLLDMGEGTDEEDADVDELALAELPDPDEADAQTRVHFYRAKEGEDWERAPVAIFPDIVEGPGPLMVRSYVHVGQHGSADITHMHGSGEYAHVDEGDAEVRALADELERIGYRFPRSTTVYDEDTVVQDLAVLAFGQTPAEGPPAEDVRELGKALGEAFPDPVALMGGPASDGAVERGDMRRVDRLAKALPEREVPGDRRVDEETRASVDDVPQGTDEDVLERRRKLARKDWGQG